MYPYSPTLPVLTFPARLKLARIIPLGVITELFINVNAAGIALQVEPELPLHPTRAGAADFPALDGEYLINSREIARRRAALAGVRLAELLNELLR